MTLYLYVPIQSDMQQNISLVVLAAGMGSRYGGLKQLDALGPSGETILEYSIYDAIRAGFNKVVFVIRDYFEDDFREKVAVKFAHLIEVIYVHQEINPAMPSIDDLPERKKPWGTSHAVLVCKDVINEPFAVINADDYYGQSCFQMLGDFLREDVSEQKYAMVGYILENTLSEQGHVNRGICQADDHGNLVAVEEILKIHRLNGDISYGENKDSRLPSDAVVSMNFWGFHQSVFEHLTAGFEAFVRANKDDPKAEYFIPIIVDDLIKGGEVCVKVLTSLDRWYGVTYKEDADTVKKAFSSFADQGKYPRSLWA